jgi:hypothetical protein
MLTCTVSFTLYGTMDVTIYNRYPDIELVSPVYFCNCGTYNEPSIERTYFNVVTKIGFSFDLGKLPGGILMYKVERKGKTKFDYQPNTGTTFTGAVEDTSKITQLLVAWKISRPREPRVYTALLERSNKLVLNEDKLVQLYDENDNWPFGESSYSTWLVHDRTILETNAIVDKKDFELKIAISKGVENMCTKLALWIDPTR